MELPEKEMSEQKAAASYIDALCEVIKRDWDAIHEHIMEYTEDKHFIIREKHAVDTFFAANISLATQTTTNLFDAEQAERLNGYVTSFLDKKYRREVDKFNAVYAKAVQSINSNSNLIPVNPVHAIIWELLFNWVGKDSKKLQRLNSESRVLLLGYISEIFLEYSFWKTIKENYRLTRG